MRTLMFTAVPCLSFGVFFPCLLAACLVFLSLRVVRPSLVAK